MSRGLMLKAARELWPATVLFGLALGLAEWLLAYVLPTFHEQLLALSTQLRLVQDLVRALVGSDTAGALGPEMLMSIAWVHPVPLAIVCAHAIVCATRIPAGEVDRGTMDVLLGLPVSRWEVFLSETAAGAASGLIVLGLACAGNIAGGAGVSPDLRPPLDRVAMVLTNLLCLHAAVGGLAGSISALSDRRGKAMTAAFVLVLASFLLNYLAQFWEPARRVSCLSVMRYYKPLLALRDGAWPVWDMTVLAGVAIVSWTAAGVVFARRDLSTV